MNFDIICFDCDSTLSKIEGIDELARRVGLGDEMSKLTNAAMNGLVPLEAVYEQRLSLIRPDQASINWVADLYIAEIVDGVKDVFETLLAQGKEVHIISGGLRQAILPLAAYLNIPESRVHAVNVYFNADGSYQTYQLDSPLARTGGKADIVSSLKNQQSLVVVGDGKTDMEAKQAGAFVIGFGGVVDRAIVRELADIYITNPSLTAVLEHIL
ncbi:MAG: HAD-IB family phosphatase [Methylococcaceae bacterium]|nr:HAD-IB family phosphatase [Methylococcaceae bacterium]MDD1607318.1 HAD-IB family phosphatase [Methylococcaceae bacterium]MDD1610229.1 HAD-IB family phosphatase [Methylococcaceae bacterium]MDD1615918.1 HAD-IB family phosphatase [Methylococcaceae bacterium]OYV19074.1 MAG: HAD-superfamily hydrolase, subfamily IB (PSPase-like) [Methylococcaceae bacterium NSP1-2]